MSAPPVRVAFVSSHALPGGAERYLELLLGELGPEWVAGVVSLQDGWLVQRLRAAGHPVTVVPTPARVGMLPAAARLRRALLALDAQVVHANGVKAALVAGLALKGTGVPVLWVKHDFAWDGPLTTVTAALCAGVVGVSRAVTETFGARQRRKVHVVGNGLPPVAADAEAGRARLERLLGLGAGEQAVLLLGRLHPVKGSVDLVDAAPAVLARRPATRFGLVGGEDPGEPGYGARVRDRIAAHRLGDRVRVVGHQPAPLDLVAAADAVAVPSAAHGTGLRGEGFGLVALEAMAAGTPVVGYAAGALPEIAGDSALLVPAGDTSALADALARVLEDPALAADLRARGLRRAGDFSLERTAAAMRERYAALAR